MAKRERWNKLAEWEVSMHTISGFLGATGEGASQLISAMKSQMDQRLSNEYYNARIIIGQLHVKLAGLYKNQRIMKRLESMNA